MCRIRVSNRMPCRQPKTGFDSSDGPMPLAAPSDWLTALGFGANSTSITASCCTCLQVHHIRQQTPTTHSSFLMGSCQPSAWADRQSLQNQDPERIEQRAMVHGEDLMRLDGITIHRHLLKCQKNDQNTEFLSVQPTWTHFSSYR